MRTIRRDYVYGPPETSIEQINNSINVTIPEHVAVSPDALAEALTAA
jgi:hypothetical protein